MKARKSEEEVVRALVDYQRQPQGYPDDQHEIGPHQYKKSRPRPKPGPMVDVRQRLGPFDLDRRVAVVDNHLRRAALRADGSCIGEARLSGHSKGILAKPCVVLAG